MVIAATALADLVAASIGRRGSAPVSAFEWYVDTSTWSVVTEQRLIDWVDGGGPPSASLRDAVAREPAGSRRRSTGWSSSSGCPPGRCWPGCGTGRTPTWRALVGLLGTRKTTRLFILDVLGARSAEVARPLLRRYWPDIARHAELSPTLAAMLRCPRTRSVALAVDAAMSFTLDRYEPVAFHTHPGLMRAADAQTAVLHPAAVAGSGEVRRAADAR